MCPIKKVAPPPPTPKKEAAKKTKTPAKKKEFTRVAKKKEEPKTELPVKTEPVKTEPVKTSPEPVKVPEHSLRSEWEGMGIIGTNEDVRTFKSYLKTKGLVLGKVLLEMIRAWNAANKPA